MKFISFIGNRNLYYHDEPLAKDPNLKEYHNNNQKELALYLLEEYKTEKEYLKEKIISFFLKNNNYKFEKYFIVGTNQSSPIAGKNDTIYQTKIIKNKLEENFNECLGNVEIIEYKGNPSNEEEVMDFFRNEMHKYLKKDDDVVFLSAGGTYQTKINMILWGIDKENLNNFTVFSLSEYDNEIRKNSWPRIIKESSIKENIKKSLDSWDIKYSRLLIDNFNIINKGSPEYKYVLFLEKRINNLDLISSIKDLKETELSNIFKELSEDNREIIKEMFSLIQICYEKRNYLIITLLLKSFADIFKKQISKEKKIDIPEHNNENLRKSWNNEIIKEIKKINESERKIFFFANSRDGISKYRNSSLITHGVGSINKDEFDGLFANSSFKNYTNFMNESDNIFKWKENYDNYVKIKKQIKIKI